MTTSPTPSTTSSARYALGVDLGTTYTCAAVAGDGQPRVAQLTGTSHTIPSVVSLTETGLLAGEAADRRYVSHPAGTAREFKRRFGDPAPIVLDGQPFGADALTAALLREVVQRVETAEGTGPSAVALAHPASWGPFRLDLLRSAATQAGIEDVQLVPEPVAAAVANSDRVDPDSLVAVYDLGGGTFDAAVVRCSDDWSVVGTPEGVERLGGIDFDQAILAHVDQALDGQVFGLDSSDPEARSALMRLLTECRNAKEHLSQDTDVDIPVVLPNLQTSVRLTRGEFEAMVRPRLADSLTVLDRVVASAGVSWDDISAVLLVGGSSNIPTVGQMVGEHTGRTIISATNPHLAIALGTAAIAQRDVIRPAAPAATSPTTTTTTTTTSTTSASAATASAATASAATAARKRPHGLIVAALAAVVAVVGAVIVFSGDDAAAPVDTLAGTASDTAAPDETSAPEPSEPSDTTVPSSEPTAPGVATVDVCATDVGDIEHFGVTDSELLLLSSTGLLALDSDALTDCNIDVGAAQPIDLGQPADLSGLSTFQTTVAMSGPNGGTVLNQTTGTLIPCAALVGPSAVDNDGVLTVISGDVVERYELNKDTGCTPADSSSLTGIAANSVAVGGRNRLAVTGTDRTSGDVQLWMFDGPRNRTVVDSFDRLDGVVRCADHWCAVDAAAGVVHVVAVDGTVVGDAPLGTALSAPISDLLDLTSTSDDGAFALVRLADGTTPIIRIRS